ncbi:MAG: hypothetical protein NT000_04625 [Proteobacteria bacterium]|nr:hypothetical protein [Pseudomonadota bacterium]
MINGTAAIVDKRVITIQDAYIFRSLNRIKTGVQPVLSEEEGDELKRTVQKLILEGMVLAEMKNIQKEIAVQSEVTAWLKENSTKRKGILEVMKRFDQTEAELAQRMTRTLSADRFVELKIQTVTPVITEDEILKYYKRNEAQFRGRSFDNLKPNIIVLLKKQAVQKSLEEWVKSLKDKYTVTLLLEK